MQARGLSYLARNFRCREGEIDLVMRDGETLVFVEVRARRSRSGLERAAESVGLPKQRRLARAALRYLQQHHSEDPPPCRMDVVLLIGPSEAAPRLHWIRSAYDSAAAP